MGRDKSAETIPCVVLVSKMDTGMWRLNCGAIVQLCVGDEVTDVVPTHNPKHQDLANNAWDLTLSAFKRALLVNYVTLSASWV
jgi:hypothetical protein